MSTELLRIPSVRHTEPLLINPFSASVEIQETGERLPVEAPGILIEAQDPDFLLGIYWGRLNYFEAVEDFVYPDGTKAAPTVTSKDYDEGRVRIGKVLDVTAQEVTQFIFDTIENPHSRESKAWRAGYIVGHLNACADVYLGQECELCGNRVGTCTHEKS